MKKLIRRKSRLAEEQAEHQRKLMRAIGELDPYADSDPSEVEERLRRIRHAGHSSQVA